MIWIGVLESGGGCVPCTMNWYELSAMENKWGGISILLFPLYLAMMLSV